MSTCLSSAGIGVDPIRAASVSHGGGVEFDGTRVGQIDAVAHQIPVRAEVVGHPAGPLVDAEPVELAEFDERPAAVDQPARRLGLVEQTIEQVVPLLFEGEAALEFVEHGEARR